MVYNQIEHIIYFLFLKKLKINNYLNQVNGIACPGQVLAIMGKLIF